MSRWTEAINTRIEVVEPPVSEPLDLDVVREQHLRLSGGSAENDYVERLVRSARRFGEWWTRRAWMPQTIALYLDRFPIYDPVIYLPRPPLLEVVSLTYLDTDGVEQTLVETTDFKVSASGRENAWSRLAPVYGTTWPASRCEMDAVTVTFRAGFEDESVSPVQPDVPDDLVQGALILVGEMYKQRSESVHAFNQNPALVRCRDLWLPYRIF